MFAVNEAQMTSESIIRTNEHVLKPSSAGSVLFF